MDKDFENSFISSKNLDKSRRLFNRSTVESLLLSLILDKIDGKGLVLPDEIEMLLYDFADDVLDSLKQKVDYFVRTWKDFEVKDFE